MSLDVGLRKDGDRKPRRIAPGALELLAAGDEHLRDGLPFARPVRRGVEAFFWRVEVVGALNTPPYVDHSHVSAALDAEFIHVPDA